jgi:hypothetical protein
LYWHCLSPVENGDCGYLKLSEVGLCSYLGKSLYMI